MHNIQDYEKPNEMMSIEMPKTDNIYFPHAMYRTRDIRVENSPREERPGDSSINDGQPRRSINDRQSSIDRQLISDRQSTSRASTSGYYDRRSSSQQSGGQQSSRVPVSSGSITSDAPSDLHISPLIIISARSPSGQAQATLSTSYRQIKPNTSPPKIFCNLDRMTHYVEEPNEYKLFFKKPHFSACGRFIASPYDRGFRLLSFNSECTELSDEVLCSQFRAPQKLYEIKQFQDHSNYVTTVNFSPTNHHIVSGCLNGQVNFYQPVL